MIKVLCQGPSGKHQHYESHGVAVRVLNLHKHPKPRVMLLTVEDAGLACEFEVLVAVLKADSRMKIWHDL